MAQVKCDVEEGIECTLEEVLEYCRNLPSNVLPTDKNTTFKRKSLLTDYDLKEYVKKLTKDHFKEEIDDLTPNHSGKMYVFKKMIKDKYFCYIKVKINRTKNGEILVIVSFHEDEKLK